MLESCLKSCGFLHHLSVTKYFHLHNFLLSTFLHLLSTFSPDRGFFLLFFWVRFGCEGFRWINWMQVNGTNAKFTCFDGLYRNVCNSCMYAAIIRKRTDLEFSVYATDSNEKEFLAERVVHCGESW